MRLDKFLSHATGQSRKDVKRWLHAQAVTVNGDVIRNAGHHVDEQDQIAVEGRTIAAPSAQYLMLNKPAGYVCATDDPTHPTVLSLIDHPRAEQLHIAGRLDLDTTGLVLLTDDGQWSHRVTSPRHKLIKCYHATLAEPLCGEAEAAFSQGILLQGESRRTRPAQLERLSACEVRVYVGEGRYHQVKRMFAALGNRVLTLHRERIGQILLDPDLAEGDYRSLSADEIASVLNTEAANE